MLVGLPFLTAIAWLLPEPRWPAAAQALSPLAVSGLTPDREGSARAIERTLGRRLPAASARGILRGMAGEGILSLLQVLRSHRGDRWAPAVGLAGFERVEKARQAGRGVILWVAHGFHGHLGAKVAFGRAGLAVTHLSSPTHGLSSSRFGIRYLNRLQTTVEDRYIAERVLLPMQGQNAALNVLVRRLRANRVVSITAQRGTGRTVDAPFLEGMLPLAPGGPALAHMTGAALLPVFAFRSAEGVIEVTVEAPIAMRADAPRDAAVAQAVGAYAAILEPYVLRHPDQWLGWVQL